MATNTGSLSPRKTSLSPAALKAAARRVFAARTAKDYIHPYLAAVLLGLVLFTAFFLTGNGLGASGGLNSIIGFIEDLIAPGHMDRVPYIAPTVTARMSPRAATLRCQRRGAWRTIR